MDPHHFGMKLNAGSGFLLGNGTLPALFYAVQLIKKNNLLLLHMNPNPDCEDCFCWQAGV
jgi:hypothetical protein